mmetsp:Transcript_21689/g.55220  ORF Transcript_21689/g.55220 Transcript_21689/m.55220 type:complete len:260 (-) Transcript_21689:1271-2050(-)
MSLYSGSGLVLTLSGLRCLVGAVPGLSASLTSSTGLAASSASRCLSQPSWPSTSRMRASARRQRRTVMMRQATRWNLSSTSARALRLLDSIRRQAGGGPGGPATATAAKAALPASGPAPESSPGWAAGRCSAPAGSSIASSRAASCASVCAVCARCWSSRRRCASAISSGPITPSPTCTPLPSTTRRDASSACASSCANSAALMAAGTSGRSSGCTPAPSPSAMMASSAACDCACSACLARMASFTSLMRSLPGSWFST